MNTRLIDASEARDVDLSSQILIGQKMALTASYSLMKLKTGYEHQILILIRKQGTLFED